MSDLEIPHRRNGDVDPTANVLLLVQAAVKRLDDLREVEVRRINELAACREECNQKLVAAETRRLDALRTFDVSAVAAANDRAREQAALLASQVAGSAETLRTLVATTAASVAQQLSQLSTNISDRLTLLEKSQYKGEGRSGLSAPLLMLIAALAGGIVSYLIQQALQGT